MELWKYDIENLINEPERVTNSNFDYTIPLKSEQVDSDKEEEEYEVPI